MHNYKKLVKEIRKKSFPEIKKKIVILKFKIPLGSMGVFYIIPGIHLMLIHPKNDLIPKKQVIGILAHELSHLSIDDKNNYFQNFIDVFKYWITSQKWRIKCEKDTDRLAIRKGYGKELLASRIAYEKKLKKKKKGKNILKYYLTSKEIKACMNKIKN